MKISKNITSATNTANIPAKPVAAVPDYSEARTAIKAAIDSLCQIKDPAAKSAVANLSVVYFDLQ